jgi:hypothetical protein
MTRGRGKRLSPDLKARVALEAAKGHKTEVAHPGMTDDECVLVENLSP